MVQASSFNDAKKNWKELEEALRSYYSDTLLQYWDWLGGSFYPFFGVDDFGQAKVDDLKKWAGKNPTQEQLNYWLAAKELSHRLNFQKTEVFEKYRATSNMPGQLFNNWPTDEDAANQQFHRDVLAPLVNQIIQDIKVIKENALISTPERLTSVGGPFELGAAPPEGTGEALDLVLDRAGPYLAFFPEYRLL